MSKRRNHARLSKLAQSNVYGALLTALLSGVVWVSLNRWAQIDGEFGPEPHPAQHWMLQLHGAAAMWCIAVFGYLAARHVPSALRQKRNRITGAITALWMAGLIVTGWLLYYASGDLRATAIWLHWWLGIGLGLVVVIHVIAGFLTRPERARQLAEEAEQET